MPSPDLPPLPTLSISASPSMLSSPLSTYSTLTEVREAADAPSPLTTLLHDPVILKSLLSPGHRKSRHRSSRSVSHTREAHSVNGEEQSQPRVHRSRERDRDRDGDSETILTAVLAEEERQAHHLKNVLRTTGEKLENETRRADIAERKAFTAECQARDLQLRITTAESAKHQAELESSRAREEVTRYRLLAESAERDLRKAEREVTKLERLRAEAERLSNDARDVARKAQQGLKDWQDQRDGKEESRKLEAMRRYNDGRDDGFIDGQNEGYETGHKDGYDEGKNDGILAGRTEGYDAGRLAGFEEGKKIGYDEGYEEGYRRGHKVGKEEERKVALAAFAERDLEDQRAREENRANRVQKWVDTTRQATPVPPPGIVGDPIPPTRPHTYLEGEEEFEYSVEDERPLPPPPPPPRTPRETQWAPGAITPPPPILQTLYPDVHPAPIPSPVLPPGFVPHASPAPGISREALTPPPPILQAVSPSAQMRSLSPVPPPGQIYYNQNPDYSPGHERSLSPIREQAREGSPTAWLHRRLNSGSRAGTPVLGPGM